MGTLDNRKAIENELAIINDPLTAEERPAIVELVGQLHAASRVEELFNLHTKLLVRYLARQRVREELEAERTGVRDRIRALAAQVPSGVRAEVAFGGHRDDVFLRVARGPVSLAIPPSLRERLLFELLTPDSAIELVAGTLDCSPLTSTLSRTYFPVPTSPGSGPEPGVVIGGLPTHTTDQR